MVSVEKLLKQIDFAARIWLTREARMKFNFIKAANLRRYIAIGKFILSLYYKYGDSPTEEEKIDVKKFKEIARKINPPSRRWGRKIA